MNVVKPKIDDAPFAKVLIANRGEIACRVIRTAKRMGLRSVAVYSDADAGSMHVRLADESRHVGPSDAARSYLDIERIVSAAQDSGAGAIHPGYGFLSENPEFVERVEGAGLIFVGPPARAVRDMGLKDSAKAIMERAGVPVVPGWSGFEDDSSALSEIADGIGYPILIKPVAGGGGKGMRVVLAAADFRRELEQARREAESAFGSGRVLLERLIENPRHIEVQVFGDRHGNVVHLFERDCSTQRRRQKIIEESPAPGISPSFRTAVCRTAVTAARAIGYVGAGTVEFIADGRRGLDPDAFWFLEMNTRLQVEHPVTEEVTGIDLVEWQFRIASGQSLPRSQDEIRLQRHAIEARLYAEDASKGFMPAPGRLTRLSFPDGVRVDTGVCQGDTISSQYDPMIAKIIATGTTREEAAEFLKAALSSVELSGTACNVPLLLAVLAQDKFAAGMVDTGWLEGSLLAGHAAAEPPDEAFALAGIELSGLGKGIPVEAGFRIWGQASWDLLLKCGAASCRVTVAILDRGGLSVGLAGRTSVWRHSAEGWVEESLDGRPFVCGFDGKAHVLMNGIWTFESVGSLASSRSTQSAGSEIVSPMPGLVRKLMVEVGQRVKTGERIAAIEAMKMEHMLTAQTDGQIQSLLVAEGDQVDEGQTVATLQNDD